MSAIAASPAHRADPGRHESRRRSQEAARRNLKRLHLDHPQRIPAALLDQSISVSGRFPRSREVVSDRGPRFRRIIQRYTGARHGRRMDGKHVIVLSMAAPLLPANRRRRLQDQGPCHVIGTLSFGKGSVQTIIRWPRAKARSASPRRSTTRRRAARFRSTEISRIGEIHAKRRDIDDEDRRSKADDRSEASTATVTSMAKRPGCTVATQDAGRRLPGRRQQGGNSSSTTR